MDANEIRAKVAAIRNEIEAGLEIRGRLAGSDAVSLIADRVRNEGKSADGAQFSAYSTVKVPAYWMVNRSRNQTADNRVRELARKRETISYKDFRQLNGLRVDRKNFEFTGELWRRFDVKAVKVGNTVIEITVGGTDERSGNLFTWLSAKEGKQINDISTDELKIIEETLKDWVQGIIQKHLP